MHASALDAGDLSNTFTELLLHCVVVANLLHELAGRHGWHIFQPFHALHI